MQYCEFLGATKREGIGFICIFEFIAPEMPSHFDLMAIFLILKYFFQKNKIFPGQRKSTLTLKKLQCLRVYAGWYGVDGLRQYLVNVLQYVRMFSFQSGRANIHYGWRENVGECTVSIELLVDLMLLIISVVLYMLGAIQCKCVY